MALSPNMRAMLRRMATDPRWVFPAQPMGRYQAHRTMRALNARLLVTHDTAEIARRVTGESQSEEPARAWRLTAKGQAMAQEMQG